MWILLLPIGFASLLGGCAAATPASPASAPLDELAELDSASDSYRLQIGDTVGIRYTFHPDMNQTEPIPPDGKITVPIAGNLELAGRTTAEVESTIRERTKDRLRDPEVRVSVVRHANQGVYVAGEVFRPGFVRYQHGLTPLRAVILAGGLRDSARIDSVVLLRLEEGELRGRTIDMGATLLNGIPEPFDLEIRDVVYVPRTAIVNVNIWVQQHITDLIPFVKGAALGAGVPL